MTSSQMISWYRRRRIRCSSLPDELPQPYLHSQVIAFTWRDGKPLVGFSVIGEFLGFVVPLEFLVRESQRNGTEGKGRRCRDRAFPCCL